MLLRSPARASIAGFLMLIFWGTFLLMLPAASREQPMGFVDALFTSTSASCVTGLIVVDTGARLSLFGQLVVLTLIQVGGLGIMTISTLFLLMAGRRPSLTGRVVITDTFTHSGEHNLSQILKEIFFLTVVIEGLGAAVMFFRFLPRADTGTALFLSLFHSISAFCNAGFSVYADSLIGYRQDWIMNFTICFLIICGGIGFLVISELRQKLPYSPKRWRRLSLHSKLVLSTTLLLLACGTVSILLMEWNNTLKPLTVPERLLASFFQSATARTAGFNTLQIENMANETLFFLVLLMFVGACPGSCAGGIKTTTLATLTLLGISKLRGKVRTQVFQRTIPEESVNKAISVLIISVTIIACGTLALQMSELGEIPHPLSRGKFLELLFEAVSAFGTVGLSTGVTPFLSATGRLIIICIMFVGRLGPLVIALAVSRRQTARYYYAEENIIVG